MIDRRDFMKAAGALALGSAMARADEGTAMLTRKIPGSDESLPVIGFGNSTAFRDNDFATTSSLLDILREKGGRFIDIHGSSEDPIGRYMDENDANKDFFIGTNLYRSDGMSSEERIRLSQTIQGKNPLDLLFLPRPAAIKEQWPQMRAWKDQGLARHIGVAATGQGFFGVLETLIASGSIDFIQINYSMLEPEANERLLPMAQDKGVAVVVNRPFVNGEYFPLVAGKPLPNWAADFDCMSWAQFSLKFIIANPAVTCAITETSKVHHAVDNLSAGFGRLPDAAEQKRMRELLLSFRA